RHTRSKRDWSSDVCSSDLHLESIEKMKEYLRPTEGIIGLVLGGSVAKGNERPDSDLDALVILPPEAYAKKLAEGRTAECVFGHRSEERRVGRAGRARWTPS